MKQKVIVYGLGENFQIDCAAIHEKYDVVGYCDRDERKFVLLPEGSNTISRAQLKEFLASCDFVLLAMSYNRFDIAQDLVVNLDIPADKIGFFRYSGELDEENALVHNGMEFYGQFADDAVLLILMRCLNYKKIADIRYLEIGTNDPIISNNTFLFYSLGARGVLVDPLPLVEAQARKMRPRDRVLRAAVSSTGGKTATFIMSAATQGSSLHSEYAGNKPTKISVPVLGINELLYDIGFVPDIFVVDAEGEDENIVRNIDFHKYRPVVMEIEINKAEQDGKMLTSFLKSKGYEMFTRIGSNGIYVDKAALKKADFDSVNRFICGEHDA